MTSLDFGYPWWLSYGHVVFLVPALTAFALGWQRSWPRWSLGTLGAIALWAFGSLLVMREFNASGVPQLPVSSFMSKGEGRVLDIGAGTGRSALMVLQSRPRVTLVASDEFGHSFEHHFGPGADPRERLKANLAAAGVAGRATIETADMRKLPFADASFDGIVSAYAIDHVGGQGARQALAEAARVLKPGGEFLLMLVHNDGWTRFAFGPLLSHGGTRGAGWWEARVREAGFQVAEQGTRPATLYFLLKR